MIATTLGQVALAEPALAQIAAIRLPVKTAYHVAKLLRLVQDETRLFQERRNEAIRRHGTERPATAEERAASGPTIVEVLPGHEGWSAFLTEMRELESVSVTLPWGPLTLDMLGQVEIEPSVLLNLGPLLADDESPAVPQEVAPK